ncbi:hypothetical protein Ciccas_004066, partial [Cichlidogyrus casuarinus]
MVDLETAETTPSLRELVQQLAKRLALTIRPKPHVEEQETPNADYDLMGLSGRSKIHLDWTTAYFLLHDLRSKLDYLHRVPNKNSPRSWLAFDMLDALVPSSRNLLFSHCLPGVVKVINSLFKHFDDSKPLQTADGEKNCALQQTLCLAMLSLLRLCTALPFLPRDSVFSLRKKTEDDGRVDEFFVLNVSQVPLALEATNKAPVAPASRDLLGSIEKSSNKEHLQLDVDKVDSLLNWLLDHFPEGLPSAAAALLHARLVFQLAPLASKSPDLEDYTRTLLHREWASDLPFE